MSLEKKSNIISLNNSVALELTEVSKTFSSDSGPVEALKNISIKVKEGEFLCVFGPSGCGKSTLLNLMAGLDEPTSGTIKLFGKEAVSYGPDRIVIFQEAGLFPWLTALGNVEFGLKVQGMPKAERREKALAMLEMVNLTKFKYAFPHQLSGGMKQRVAIARGLVLDPKVLLMDEPFAALDAQTRDSLHEDLYEIWMKTKKTILFVTHNVREAAKLGDRIILLSANPGQVQKEYKIDLPRPRVLEDVKVLEISKQVMTDMRSASILNNREKVAL